jgi:hypothetical protein
VHNFVRDAAKNERDATPRSARVLAWEALRLDEEALRTLATTADGDLTA